MSDKGYKTITLPKVVQGVERSAEEASKEMGGLTMHEGYKRFAHTGTYKTSYEFTMYRE